MAKEATTKETTSVVVSDEALKKLESEAQRLAAENLTVSAALQSAEEQLEKVRQDYRNLQLANPVTSAPGATINAAFSKAQALFTNITKDREVEVKPKDGGKGYTFKYATLPAMMKVIRGPLGANGLALAQFPTINLKGPEKSVDIETRLLHSSGEQLVGVLTLPLLDLRPQGIGIVITYACRYAIKAMFGLAQEDESDLDDDHARFAGMEAPPEMDEPPATTAPASKASKATVDAKPTTKVPKKKAIDLGLALQAAATPEELASAAAEVAEAKKRGDIDAKQSEDLGGVWKRRNAELSAPKPTTSPPPAESAPPPEPGSDG